MRHENGLNPTSAHWTQLPLLILGIDTQTDGFPVES